MASEDGVCLASQDRMEEGGEDRVCLASQDKIQGSRISKLCPVFTKQCKVSSEMGFTTKS